MKNFELDAKLREMLHECADPITADDNMKARIDRMIEQENKRARGSLWKKAAIGVAAALCLTTVGAFASGHMTGLASSLNWERMQTSIEDLQKDTDKVLSDITLAESLNGGAFERGAVEYVDKVDDNGKRLSSYPEIYASYQGDLDLSVRAYDPELDDSPVQQFYEGQPREDREIDGVTVHYQSDRYLDLPVNEEPTEEENKKQENNELYISVGSDTREECNFQWASWQQGDRVYLISTFSDTVTADDLFAAAKDAMQA